MIADVWCLFLRIGDCVYVRVQRTRAEREQRVGWYL